MMFGAIGQYAIGQINFNISYSVEAEPASFTLTGQAVTLTHYVPNTGSLLAIGEGAIGEFGNIAPQGVYDIVADVGAFTLSGQAVSSLRTYVVPFEAASFALTGQSVGLAVGYHVGAEAGTFTLTGQDAALRWSAAEPGAFTLTGQSVTLQHHHVVQPAAGAFALTGQNAGLSVAMPADTGAFVLTGQAATMLATRVIYPSELPATDADEYRHILFAAIGEVAIGGSKTQVAAAPVVTYVLTGHDTILRQGFSVTAEVAAFTLTGQDATVLATRTIPAAVGAFVVSGQVAQLAVSMPGDVGTFTFTGQAVEFTRRRRRFRGNPRIGNPVRGLTRNGNTISARAA